jgi:tetrapyrrole methylase family protein/MazG family protein
MADVIATVDAKIKHRHPHVWGERVVSGTGEVVHNWEALKAQERQAKGSDGAHPSSALDGVPQTLPALAQAEAYGRRAARVGFDWPDVGGVVEKIGEEMQELQSAANEQERTAELGDLLFAVVNWARWLNLDPEAALRRANARFARRFAWVEAEARRQGFDPVQMELDELEVLWQAAKKAPEV